MWGTVYYHLLDESLAPLTPIEYIHYYLCYRSYRGCGSLLLQSHCVAWIRELGTTLEFRGANGGSP